VLGIALHTTGTAAKFFADQIESSNLGPYEAILHQVAYARSYADRIIGLSHGCLLMDKPATEFFDEDSDALYAPQSSQQIAAASLGR
jgi:ABC-type phosphate/phosphonate transport system ATPase subunit